MSGALLSVTNLRAGYGDVVAVRDVEINVNPGEVVAVLGPNGAGKTTLLGAIAGLLPGVTGEIRLEGRAMGRLAAHERARGGISLVQENKRVFRAMTVHDNLVVSAPRTARADVERRIADVTELFPALLEKMSSRAGELSGGQQQMLAIAQALMAEPRLLLLDEPSAGLAPRLTAEVMSRVADIAARGIGVLLVEQTVHEALRIADRVYLLRLGVCVEQEDLRPENQQEILAELYLGSQAADQSPGPRTDEQEERTA